MSVHSVIGKMLDLSDAGDKQVGLYRISIVKATRKRNLTTFTFKIVTEDLTPNDLVRGLTGFLLIGPTERVVALDEPELSGEAVAHG